MKLDWTKIANGTVQTVIVAVVLSIPPLAISSYTKINNQEKKIEKLESEMVKLRKISKRFSINEFGQIGVSVDEFRIVNTKAPDDKEHELVKLKQRIKELEGKLE